MPGRVLRAVVTRVGGALRELGELAAMGKQTTMCKPSTMRELGGMRVAAAGIGLAARRRQVDVRAGRERARVKVLDRPAAAHRRAARDEVGRRRRRRRATVRGHVDDVDGALLRRGRLRGLRGLGVGGGSHELTPEDRS